MNMLGKRFGFFLSALLVVMLMAPGGAFALTVGEVVKDLACPCVCPLVLEDCNMTCGLEWKDEVGNLIKKGMTKQEIIDHFVRTYGEDARLTALQKLQGKTYQFTRSFGVMEWTMLWAGVGFWVLVLFFGIYLGVRKLRSKAYAA
ncbi:MAG: hypothetical protein A3G18_00140 [Rhodospirillales bacterium RIFCSPLOWO2_12_FULL_58_28]|nr:MAG: hypothetical protein A3H92_02750 [Rhodospirillales bacterium RIFCSPLOWO2_02_FULL_58_16]OHC79877.1 MAG: hypothetical protein A3G18_00140 [Rhodospirillales bacterium RIFCSPLOWO2_12_FULL_58_28]